MRKTLLWATMCLFASAAFAEDEPLQVLLHHQGAVKMYNASDFATAVSDAAQGDTLYLPKGSFPGFTMTKEYTVRGAGNEETTITSDISINIPGKPVLTQSLLEGLKTPTVTLDAVMTDLKIKQCRMSSFSVNAVNNTIFLDRCYIGTYNQSENITGIKVQNSYIDYYYVESATSEMCSEFINCNIYGWRNQTVNKSSIAPQRTDYLNTYAFFTNCIIRNHAYNPNNYSSSSSSTGSISSLPHASLVNCLLTSNIPANLNQDCYINSNAFNLSDEFWEETPYLGTDGTRVGNLGGSTPYTMNLAIPKVTTSSISHDVEHRTLNVKLKVTSK